LPHWSSIAEEYMSSEIACPRCDFVLQPKTGETTPSHCPACGTRILCPRCGSTLDHHDQVTAPLHCSHCHAEIDGAPTRPFDEPSKPAAEPVLALPGFEVRGELGRGGMGIVYRALQRSLNREVAVKVLPPALAMNPYLLERFRNEASVAGALVDSHILPVFDVQEVQGVPVIVMPLIEGSDLGKIIRDRSAAKKGTPTTHLHPWAALDDRAYLEKVLPLLDKVVDAVAALHRRGVLHRDIKPSNVLVDKEGNPWLSDFGLARLQDSSIGTHPGMGMGTQGYAAPEQTRGEKEIDFRADVFSLGVTLYQALTLELPYSKKSIDDSSSTPSSVSRTQPKLFKEYDTVLGKALEKDQARRYHSTADFQEDWLCVRYGLLPKARPVSKLRRVLHSVRRHPWAVAVLFLLILLSGLLAWSLAPHDPTERRTVRITTLPPGARVVLVPLDPESGIPTEADKIRPKALTPVTVPKVPVGQYMVVAEVEGYGFHEVFRTVPSTEEDAAIGIKGDSQRIGDPDRPESLVLETPQANRHRSWQIDQDGTVEFSEITIPATEVSSGMARFEGGDFAMDPRGLNGAPSHVRKIPTFYLDTTEVTVGDWLKVWKSLPKSVAPSASRFQAITFVSFDQAISYAEIVGKRLPDEAEFEFAATMGGTRRYPWGNDKKTDVWPFGDVGSVSWDRTPTDPPVYGLMTNVAEWTSSWNWPYPTANPRALRAYRDPQLGTVFRGRRIFRGGPTEVIESGLVPVQWGKGPQWDPTFRHALDADMRKPGLGFRCARSRKARFLDP
jgi:serine/threonine protein kinase/formylglycine-generating enzyme required for sulfatase activity